MTAKKRRMKLGKAIRRETGLPLPVCMTAAKLIDRAREREVETTEITRDASHPVRCGDGCCFVARELVGPRGSYRYSWT